jgi:hypothetical protein
MDPATIALIAPQLLKIGTGLFQTKSSEKYSKHERPKYEIPQAAYDEIDIAKMLASINKLPGQQATEERLASSTGAGLEAIKDVGRSSADITGAIPSILEKEQEKLTDLGTAAGQYKLNAQRMVGQALGNLASYQDKQWQLNEYMPYLSAMEAAKGLSGSGMQNIYGGISNIGGIASQAFGGNFGSLGMGSTDFENMTIEDLLKQLNVGTKNKDQINIPNFPDYNYNLDSF